MKKVTIDDLRLTKDNLQSSICNRQSPESFAYYQGATRPKGVILPKDQICISPNDRGFMFADGVYEVVRSYGGKLFRLDQHLARLQRSLEAVRIRFRDVAALSRVAQELLVRNNLASGDATIYIQVTRGAYPRAHAFPPETVVPTVYVEANRLVPPVREMEEGVSVLTTPDIRWRRCDIKSIGLLLNVLGRQAAVEAGAYETIFVRDGILTEGTHTNVFGVKNGTVLTHRASNEILGGITRDIVFEFCRGLKIHVSEAGVRENELSDLDELFLAGTTVEIMPIVRAGDITIGTGEPGPLTRRLQVAFQELLSLSSR